MDPPVVSPLSPSTKARRQTRSSTRLAPSSGVQGTTLEKIQLEERLYALLLNYAGQRFKPCWSFGRHRETMYPRQYFFCSNCRLFESQYVLSTDKRCTPNSLANRCTAYHTSFLYPTDTHDLNNKVNRPLVANFMKEQTGLVTYQIGKHKAPTISQEAQLFLLVKEHDCQPHHKDPPHSSSTKHKTSFQDFLFVDGDSESSTDSDEDVPPNSLRQSLPDDNMLYLFPPVGDG